MGKVALLGDEQDGLKFNLDSNQSEVKQEFEYAGFWLRVGAALIDSLILSGIDFIMKKLVSVKWIDGVLWIVYGLLAIWFVSSKFQGTPGKILLKIKVIDLQGRRISFFRSVGRYCTYYLFMFLGFLCYIEVFITAMAKNMGIIEIIILLIIIPICGLTPIVGYLMVAFTACKQGLHDKIFNTLVIKSH